jgi:hypothetical protein
MTPRKAKVLITAFTYSGNGGIPTQAEQVSEWIAHTMVKAGRDERIEWIKKTSFCDTPITATRNRAVVAAREIGADILVMVDSDMWPDNRVGRDPEAKPFFDTSFDFLYKHYDCGPVVIGAPYCGPPPIEMAYVFTWRTQQSDHPNVDYALKPYSREEAATMKGIQHCAALPTGLIMFDMRAFELTEPKRKQETLIKRLMAPVEGQYITGEPLTLEQVREHTQRCLDMKQQSEQSWFYYEWTNEYQSEKASTEDVTATRDIASHGVLELGYNPLRVNWDAWAGHWKVKCVDKPVVLSSEDVNNKLIRAATDGQERAWRTVELECEGVDA